MNNQLVFVNVIEGRHNPNLKPIEQYAIRDESGKMIMNNILIFDIFIPDLILMMQRNNELFLPEELILDTFEIEDYHKSENDIESKTTTNDDNTNCSFASINISKD